MKWIVKENFSTFDISQNIRYLYGCTKNKDEIAPYPYGIACKIEEKKKKKSDHVIVIEVVAMLTSMFFFSGMYMATLF